MAILTKTRNKNKSKEEGQIAREIEDLTAELPSDAYLWSALGVMGVSLALNLLAKSDKALFVGQWAAPILIMGVYNKIVKTQGSE